MRRILLLLVATSVWHFAQAQWTTSGSNIYNTNSGNVGIGTSSPAQKVDIAGGIGVDKGNTFNGTFGPGYGCITFGASSGEGMASARASGSTNQYGIDFFTSFSRRMSITNSGTVGINTTNTQGYQFAVNGSAIFTSARVKAYGYWPDFVFGKDYRLPALDSVDQYIQTNHRLPDFPSADSIQRAGIDLGGTDAALLKKIEELTLYAIEQKKQMEEQKKQLAAQQAAMARLEMLVQTKIKH